jgi:hypothetical protein
MHCALGASRSSNALQRQSWFMYSYKRSQGWLRLSRANKTVRKAGLGSGLAFLLVIFWLQQLYVVVGVVGLQQVFVAV